MRLQLLKTNYMKKLLPALFIAALGFSACEKTASVPDGISETSVNRQSFVPGQFNPTTEGQSTQALQTATNSVSQYLAYVPKGYNKYQSVKWPLVIYLHDAQFKGNDPAAIKAAALPALADIPKNDLQFVLISPQLKYTSSGWVVDDLDKILTELLAKYNVNPDLIAVTGEGLGGNGTWDWALKNPTRFQLIAPVGGWSVPEKAATLKNLPIWAFRGNAYSGSVESMVNAVRAAGGRANLTVYPDDEKTVGTKIYGNGDLITWATNILTAKGYGNVPFPAGQPIGSFPYSDRIDQFVKQDNTQFPQMGGNLFIGSSSIDFWGDLETSFPGKNIIKRGIAGSTINQAYNFFGPYILYPYRPNKIFVYTGENDIASGLNAESVSRDFEAWFAQMRKYLPVSTVYFMSIKSSPSRSGFSNEFNRANMMIKAFLDKQQNSAYIDVNSGLLKDGQPNPAYFGPDQLHLNSSGYQVWKDILVKYQ